MGRSYRIGVVGFGVAGGTAAYLLSSAGHDVTLIERAPEVGPVGAGILLQPSGQSVLKRLGMLEEVVQDAEPIYELLAYTHRGNILTRLPYDEIAPGCFAYGVHRGSLFEAIRNRVERTNSDIELGRFIVAREIVGESVYAVAENGSSSGPFDFLVVADGSRSALRSSSGIPQRVHTYPYGAIWGVGPCVACMDLGHG